MNWTNDFIGIPQKDLGRDRDGCDCWGLVHLVLNAHGRPVPSYQEDYLSVRERVEIEALIAEAKTLPTWSRVVGPPQPFDVITFRRGALDGHIGVIVDRQRMLHVDRRAPSRIERFDISPWTNRHPSVWRWVGISE